MSVTGSWRTVGAVTGATKATARLGSAPTRSVLSPRHSTPPSRCHRSAPMLSSVSMAASSMGAAAAVARHRRTGRVRRAALARPRVRTAARSIRRAAHAAASQATSVRRVRTMPCTSGSRSGRTAGRNSSSSGSSHRGMKAPSSCDMPTRLGPARTRSSPALKSQPPTRRVRPQAMPTRRQVTCRATPRQSFTRCISPSGPTSTVPAAALRSSTFRQCTTTQTTPV